MCGPRSDWHVFPIRMQFRSWVAQNPDMHAIFDIHSKPPTYLPGILRNARLGQPLFCMRIGILRQVGRDNRLLSQRGLPQPPYEHEYMRIANPEPTKSHMPQRSGGQGNSTKGACPDQPEPPRRETLSTGRLTNRRAPRKSTSRGAPCMLNSEAYSLTPRQRSG